MYIYENQLIFLFHYWDRKKKIFKIQNNFPDSNSSQEMLNPVVEHLV